MPAVFFPPEIFQRTISRVPSVVESYFEYRPPRGVRSSVDKLLKTVPSEYLAGLGKVVLTNYSGQARRQRKKTFKSRGRKLSANEVNGFYRHKWNGQPAEIHLYIDSIFRHTPAYVSWVPLLRHFHLGEVLYHEIGHHIDRTHRPGYGEKEDTADRWSRKLMPLFLRRYASLRYLSRAIKLIKRVFAR
jgi:hypothetical protein